MTKSASTKPKKPARKNGKGKPEQKPLIQLTLDQKLDIAGVIMVGLAVVTILSMLSSTQGNLTGQIVALLQRTFGWGAFMVPVAIGVVGLWLLLRSFERTPRLSGEQSAGFLLAFFLVLMTLAWFNTAASGSVGQGLSLWLIGAVGEVGAVVLLVVGWLIAIVLLFDLAPSQIAAWFGKLLSGLKQPAQPKIDGMIAPGQPIDMIINAGGKATSGNGRAASSRSFVDATRSTDGVPIETRLPGSIEPAGPAAPSYKVGPRVRPDAPPSGMLGDATMANALAHTQVAGGELDGAYLPVGAGVASGPLYPRIIGTTQPWELPKIGDLFESGEDGALGEDDLREKAHIIEDTLRSFGVEGRVIEVNRGPAITQFGIEPGFINRAGKQTKVKVSKISSLADDLALALAAKSIRIEAPVPGKNIVGIEVPNSEIATVCLRDVLESESFQNIKGPLPIALGQDVSGQAVATDLGNMPHLLIAGTTGSGKSVCVNAIISCLMAYHTPDELKLLMVDPKRVELTTYNGVPHLIAPVVVDLEKVVGVLNWVTREMDDRYRRFARSGSRNIDDYNRKIEENNAKDGGPGSGGSKEPKMPYIVVVIDELADLMMLAPDETEKTICRLAQMARATGIHLIIATQRPSVDVVTGLIKANFPARIAFSVASSIDSRVILDTTGAERLLGRGDMLYVAPDVGSPQRLQGCFVSDREIHKLVRYWKGVRGTEAVAPAVEAIEPPMAAQPSIFDSIQAEIEQANAAGEDDLLQRAIDVVRVQKKASISLLQRQLRIGYTRAARLIDQMEEKGIVGPATNDSRWREVLVDFDLD